MSLARVRKHIRNLNPTLRNPPLLRTIPVVLSDSKARYIENIVNSEYHPDNKIVWWWKKGATAEDQLDFLEKNLENKFREFGSQHFTIYVWLGTCNVTVKSGQFIDIVSENNDSATQACKALRDIYKFLAKYSSIKVVFFEIPYFSIYLWNLHKGHPNPELYRHKDKILEGQIDKINKFVRETNLILRGNSPSFGLDLLKVRKHFGQRAVYSNNYGLYLDGVHPHPDLARLWLIRILVRVIEDCKNPDILLR